jgi:hypothetical protein
MVQIAPCHFDYGYFGVSVLSCLKRLPVVVTMDAMVLDAPAAVNMFNTIIIHHGDCGLGLYMVEERSN